jgi:hypothetical protein
MSQSEPGGRRYEVRHSAAVGQSIRDLHVQASQAGAVKAFRAAFNNILQRLEIDPDDVGEPLYRLKVMRMRVCHVIVRPLVMDFAISEDSPMVFIKGVRML